MTVNLSKNSAALMVAYKEVVDAKSDTNWALFTYEGNSNDVRLAEKGEGGLEEMVEELSSGKIMYAFCRVHDPSSGLPKYVLINWTGEGVQNSRKGICANHVCSIAKFLKGAHVTINARTEEDVDPESILTKVAKASGVNFNFHTTQENTCAPRRLLVSGYQKTNAIKGIQRTEKDDFWAQAQREEEFHQNEGNKTAEQEREKMKRKRREMDKRQEQEREKVAKAPGANLNFHTTQENTHAPRGPVGSVYQKTNAIEEIQRTEKDHFWAQAQREEEVRRKEVIKTAEQQREKMEQERREMDKRQEQEGEKDAKANFNLHTTKENTRAPRGPVGSGYQKTNAIKGIQRIVKDHFWAQAQREEEVRRKEVKKTREEEQEREKMERERREMDKRQEHEREKGSYQKKQEMEERQKEKQQRENQTMDSNNRQKTGTHIAASVQKANEAKLLISQRPFNPRDVFKQQVQSGPPLATSKPGKLQSPFLSPKSSERVTQMGPRCRLPVAPLIPGASSSSLSFGSASPVDHSEGAPSTITSDLIVAAPSPEAPASPVQSTEEYWSDEFDDDDDDDEEEEDAEVATPAESTDQEDIYEEPPPYGNEEEELYDDIYQAMPVEEHGLETSGHGICARALYDYQAVDDTELSLDPNDIITGIEMRDEGWWKGYGPGGYYGLFPGNYVELL